MSRDEEHARHPNPSKICTGLGTRDSRKLTIYDLRQKAPVILCGSFFEHTTCITKGRKRAQTPRQPTCGFA